MEDEIWYLSPFKSISRFLFTPLSMQKKFSRLLFMIFVKLVLFLLQARFFTYPLLKAGSCEAVKLDLIYFM